MPIVNNPQLQLARDFLSYTGDNIFLTGKAGTGKTTFLKTLKKSSPKRMVVVAPTGVAAINAGGVTIHSFFQLPFSPHVPGAPMQGEGIRRFSKNKINIIRSLDLLVIDEISMVRADMLDAIDEVLRRFKNRSKPFGGVQLLMIGDLQQLAPVVKDDDWNILKNYYETAFFFSSRALKNASFTGIGLKHIYRQSDQDFIDLLNKVRDNDMDENDIRMLNRRYISNFNPPEEEGYITLTTHNYQASRINANRLNKLTNKKHTFECSVEGDFPESSYPADAVLEIKTGAQVMFLKNDPSVEKRYYNGKIGKVKDIDEDQIEVLCPGETEPIIVERTVWENTKYNLNERTTEIEEDVVGKFVQFPLKLAWAITIHKSQGLTFEKAIIDAKQSFAHGQVYVALSRCKNLEGLVLSTPLDSASVINDETVIGFTEDVEQNQPDENDLESSRKNYELELIKELYDFSFVIRSAHYILKVWEDNAGFLMGNLNETLRKMLVRVKEEMADVAERFYVQVENLLKDAVPAEKNTALQERIQKATGYFSAKMQEIILQPLDDAGFQTDNQALRKRITDAIGRLEMDLNVKKACLEASAKQFSVPSYLEARAVAAIEKPTSKTRSKVAAVNVKNPDFYKKLVEWRDFKAEETGLAISRVLRQKVMAAVANELPATSMKLQAVKGMGGKKMEQFGQEILALILEYRSKKGMDIPLNANEEVALAGLSTKEQSLKLFQNGLSVVEVAKKRNLAPSTIEGHLAHFVQKGELDIFRVVPHEKYEIIKTELGQNPGEVTTSDIKNKLGDDFSYGEIRMVMADLQK
ncbi:MAG: helix-turn-helix domain-containing protein [Tangfeifania sp.]